MRGLKTLNAFANVGKSALSIYLINIYNIYIYIYEKENFKFNE